MRVIEINQANIDSFNVIYDAVTKHENAGGVSGLTKIVKLLDKFDAIAVLGENDIYSLRDKEQTYNLFLEDDEWTSIKGWFDTVKWHPMKARGIKKAYDLVESAKEHKLEIVKETPKNEEKK